MAAGCPRKARRGARQRGALALSLALACAAPLPAAATAEYLLPTLFDVTGVAADDVLNIRARPGAKSEIVGTLAPDARRVEVVAHDESGRWAQVNTGERSGWVALRYLAYRTDVWQSGRLPDPLSCFGTEPFWSLTPGAGEVTLSRPVEDDRTMRLDAVLDPGVFRSPRRAILASDGQGRVTAVITRGLCSDGMSDRAYGLDATIVVEGAGGPRLLTGCCSIAPR